MVKIQMYSSLLAMIVSELILYSWKVGNSNQKIGSLTIPVFPKIYRLFKKGLVGKFTYVLCKAF